MTLVSVIVPVYQVVSFLDACVTSVLVQTHRNLEILLIDDGSTDGSEALCDTWAGRDERVRVVHQPNGGLSAARNRGIDLAGGDFLTFVDSDDVIAPFFVEHLLGEILGSEADIAVAGLVPFATEAPTYTSMRSASQTLPTDDALVRIMGEAAWSACGKLYARGLFASGLRFRPGLLYEDLEFTPRVLGLADSVVFSKSGLYGYRQERDGSIMDASRRVTSPDLIAILQGNIDAAVERFGAPSSLTDHLVTAYVLEASGTVESMSFHSRSRANSAFLSAYRRFIRRNIRLVSSAGILGRPYLAMLALSSVAPRGFTIAFRIASLLKRRTLPQLRRMGG